MIYTVTLNPSIDYVVEVNELTAGEIMRTKAEDLIFGERESMYPVCWHSLG